MEGPDRVLGSALPTVAAALGDRPGSELGRPALRDELASALHKRVGFMSTGVAVDFVRPQGWSEPSFPVDVTVRGRIAGIQSVVCACAWCDDDDALAAVVPALLAAVCVSRDRGSYAYLVAATPEELDSPPSLLDLLDETDVATLPLIAADLVPTGRVTATVPGRLRTFPVAEAWLTVDGAPWMLRASRIEPAGGDVQVAL